MKNVKLQMILKLKNISRKELAEKLNVAQSTLSMKLTGKHEFTVQEAKRILEILNMSFEDVFNDEDIIKSA